MKFFILLFVFYMPFIIKSQQLTKDVALKVAKNFYVEIQQKTFKNYSGDPKFIKMDNKTIDVKNLYIYNLADNHGFVIVSANRKAFPILAYSLVNSFPEKDMPPEVKDWLSDYDRQIDKIKQLKSSASLKTTQAWNKYSDENFNPSTSSLKEAILTDISPLLSTSWNQGRYYNALCPECTSGGSGGHVWAGCVATAMAQLMKYWDYPASGQGEHTYTHSVYGEQSADFQNTVYDWANMPNALSAHNTDVATLLYHLGVSVNMNYSPSGSGAYSSTARNALIQYFKYSTNTLLTSKYNYNEESWKRLLRAELDAGRPLYYAGYGSGGHAFNCDGYQGTDYFHFNWGWGGAYNGYFYLDALKPGGHDYSNSQSAIIGAVPNNAELSFDSTSVIELTNQTPFSGTTTDGENNANLYELISWHETGKEKLHKITTTVSGRITAKITGLSEDLDVFILKYANRLGTLAYGDSIAVLDDAEPGTYYIIVDGRFASEGNYTLTVTCPDSKADLTVEEAKVEPSFIQTGQNFKVECKIKNIGNSDAAKSMLKFYVSDDQILSGDDIVIDSIDIGAIAQKTEAYISNILVLPAGIATGVQYIIFDADAKDDVDETDDDLNQASVNFTVPETGLMDCTSAIELTDNELYTGNALLQGDSIVDDYSWFFGLTNKEVIHSFTAEYSGLVHLDFAENLEGNTKLLLLAACNENSLLNSYEIWNPEDTVLKESFKVTGGIKYYLVVDGNDDMGESEGAYSIRLNLPKQCPEPIISSGLVNKCDGDYPAYVYTNWAYSNFQWLKDGVEIAGANNASFSADETGFYTVKVTENGCTGTSEGVQVTFSPKPSSAEISALGDTAFCEGGSVELQLNTGAGYTYQWTNNDLAIEGAESLNFETGLSGVYRAEVTNLSCTIKSNPISVLVWHSAKENGDILDVTSDSLISYWPFDQWGTDESGNSNYASINAIQTKDRKNHLSAFSFNGTDHYIYTTKQFAHPDTFTISLWFKTSSNGKLIGFTDQQYDQPSTSSDRHIYLDNLGHLSFGVETTEKFVISSNSIYNDNLWHLVTVSLSNLGMKMYVDAQLVAQNNAVVSAGNYSGYWKMAVGSLENWPNNPVNDHFEGKLDDIRIYNRALKLDEIEVLYSTQPINIQVEDEFICSVSDSSNIIIKNSEPNIQYQLVNVAGNLPIGNTVTGNAATINLPTGKLTKTTSFKIEAQNSHTSCTKTLDTILTIMVNESPLPQVNISSNKTGDEICLGDSIMFSSSIQYGGSSPVYQWLLNDVAIGIDSSIFSSTTLEDEDVIKLQLSSSIECASPKIVISNELVINVNSLPDNSLTLFGSTVFCAGDSSKLSANANAYYQWYQLDSAMMGNAKELWISSAGEYFLRLENSFGCVNYSDTVEFSLHDLPVVDLGKDTSINSNESLILESSSSFNEYLWSTGSAEKSILIDASYGLGEHQFWLKVNDGVCENSDTIIVDIIQITGLDSNWGLSGIKLYPNPASNQIEFSFTDVFPNDVLIEIRNIHGELTWSKNYDKQTNLLKDNVMLNTYLPGIYFLSIITDKEKISKKFIVR